MALKQKDFLGLYNVKGEDINQILTTAESMKEIFTRTVKKVPTLRGKTVINLFYEPSTRTKFSFNLAAKRLSADVMSISKSSSRNFDTDKLFKTITN